MIDDIRARAGVIIQDEKATRKHFYDIMTQASGTQLKTDKAILRKTTNRLSELDKLLQAAFEQSVLGGGLSGMFTELARKYEAEKQELTKQAQQITMSIEKQSKTENDVETYIALMKKYVNITELNRATTAELIDHITVSASKTDPPNQKRLFKRGCIFDCVNGNNLQYK